LQTVCEGVMKASGSSSALLVSVRRLSPLVTPRRVLEAEHRLRGRQQLAVEGRRVAQRRDPES